jgi:hypothetical protein
VLSEANEDLDSGIDLYPFNLKVLVL